MSAKQRTKNKIQQRLNEKLLSLSAQEETLCSMITTFVREAKTKAENLLKIKETSEFLQNCGEVEQSLDKAFSLCEVLTATAEDVIDNNSDEADSDEPGPEAKEDNSTLTAACPAEVQTKGGVQEQIRPLTIDEQTKPPTIQEQPKQSTIQEQPKQSTIQEQPKQSIIEEQPKQPTIQERTNSPTDVYAKIAHSGKSTYQPVKRFQYSGLKNPNNDSSSNKCVNPDQPSVRNKQEDQERSASSQVMSVPENVKNVLKKYSSACEISRVADPPSQETFEQKLEDKSAITCSSPKKKVKEKSQKKKKSKSDKTVTYKGKNENKDTERKKTLREAECHVENTFELSAERSTSKTNSVNVRDSEIQAEIPHKLCAERSTSKTNSVNVRDSEFQAEIPHKLCAERSTSKTNSVNVRDSEIQAEIPYKLSIEKSTVKTNSVNVNDSEFQTETMFDLSAERHPTGHGDDVPSNATVASVSPLWSCNQGALLKQDVTPVVVSEIISPWCFFVQPNGYQLKNLMSNICLYMGTAGQTDPPIQSPQVGLQCLAKFKEDGAYYRGHVTKIYNSGHGITHADVLYVDYGNKEKVKIKDLRNLPDSFSHLPSQAACCALAEVAPNNKYGLWTEEDIFTFKQYVCNQQLSCVRSRSSSTASMPIIVNLLGNYPAPATMPQFVHKQISIGQLLVNRGSAKPIDVAEQIRLLIRTEEGKEEASILNGYLAMTSGPKISEINDDSNNMSFLGDNPDGTGRSTNRTVETQAHSADSMNQHAMSANSSQQNSADSVRTSTDAENHNKWKTDNTSKTGDTVWSSSESDSKEGKANLADMSGSHLGQTDSLETVSSTVNIQSDRSTETSFQPSNSNDEQEPTNRSRGQEVMLAHVKSPGHFYVHIVSREVGLNLDNMMKNLNKHFEKMNRRKLSNLSRTFVATKKKLCCAQFSKDNNFYRAVIKGISKDTNRAQRVLIFYMDFGDEEWVDRHMIYPLPPEFSAMPPLATCCTLAFVVPKPMVDNSERHWPESCTDFFTSLAGFDKTLHMHIVKSLHVTSETSEEDEEQLLVLLIDNNGKEEVCINLELIRQGHADLDTSSGRHTKEGLELLEVWNPMEDDFLSKRNSYNIDTDDAGVATTGYN